MICHNVTVPENLILNRDKLNLIDWEYSVMNDYVWDLSAHILECEFSKKEEKAFLKLYFNNKIDNKIDNDIFLRLKLYKIMQDFLWSIWTNIKIVHGEKLRKYSAMRYERAKEILKTKRFRDIIKCIFSRKVKILILGSVLGGTVGMTLYIISIKFISPEGAANISNSYCCIIFYNY